MNSLKKKKPKKKESAESLFKVQFNDEADEQRA
jgi:hypothetical protein